MNDTLILIPPVTTFRYKKIPLKTLNKMAWPVWPMADSAIVCELPKVYKNEYNIVKFKIHMLFEILQSRTLNKDMKRRI